MKIYAKQNFDILSINYKYHKMHFYIRMKAIEQLKKIYEIINILILDSLLTLISTDRSLCRQLVYLIIQFVLVITQSYGTLY